MILKTSRRVRPASRLRFTVSAMALASGLAGAAGVVGVATPAAAQCVENPANIHTCGGQTDTPIVIVGGTSPGVYTTPGFGVDTSGNGNGLALSVSGTGLVSYTDTEDSVLAGGGVRLETTGADGLSDGDIYVFSTGSIIADGSAGLRLHNGGGADTIAVWSGPISNIGGHGVDVTTGVGSGALTLIFDNTVTGREDGIRTVFNGNGFIDITATGPVTGSSGRGISIESLGGTADGIRVRAGDVVGGISGVAIHYEGQGGIDLNFTGAVSGGTGTGIFVEAENGTADVSIRATSVSGNYAGIATSQDGDGSTFISATGLVTGDVGVQAENGVGASDITLELGDVTGRLAGVVAFNFGSGFTSVRSDGAVFGGAFNGIQVETGAASQGILVQAVDAYGDQGGIWVKNGGAGATTVRATGDVSSNFQSGIWVNAGAASGDVTVDAFNVQGSSAGISILNEGVGSTTVTTTGQVTAFGANGVGLEINTGADTTDITVVAAAVEGRESGIEVNNGGTGETFIRSTDRVSGDEYGMFVRNGANATGLSIRAVDVESGKDGIWAQNFGTGGIDIVATGTVVATDIGITAHAELTSGDVYIDANTITGGALGIGITNHGNGTNTVITRGLVEGSVYALFVNSLGTQDSYIYNSGVIRNSSALSSDLAMRVSGGYVEITNTGQLIGGIDSSAEESLTTNMGVWNNTGGFSEFTGSNDQLVNGGLIIARSDAATLDTTTWLELEVFENAAALTLRDGGAGDVLQTSADSVFSEGSTLGVDIGGPNGADMFFTSGTLELQEGAQLSVDVVGPLTLNTQYVVAAAFGGLTGEFVFDDVMLTAFAGLRDGYTDQSAYIEFVQLKALAEAGITPNQKEAAAGADSLPDGNPVKDALLLLPDEAAAIDAFDQLSGEVHPTARTVVAEDSRWIRDAALARLADGEAGGSIWGRLIGSDGVSFGDDNAARADRDSRGVLAGADYALGGNVTAGLAMGWVETDVEIQRRNSVATVDSLHGLAYVGGRFGAWGVRAGIGYAQTSVETERAVGFPGFSAALDADYDGSVMQGFVEVGYRMPARGGWVEPFVNLTALRAETDAFTETGGPAALSGEGMTQDVLASTLGLRFETNPMGAFSMRGVAGWRHAWGDVEPVGLHAFEGGETFTVLGAAQSDDAAVANVEARWRLTRKVTFGLAYDGVMGTDSADHAITAGVKVIF